MDANEHEYIYLILLNIFGVSISKSTFFAIQYGMVEYWKNGKLGLKAEKNPFFKNDRIPFLQKTGGHVNSLFQYSKRAKPLI
jgi:hypothetical protein